MPNGTRIRSFHAWITCSDIYSTAFLNRLPFRGQILRSPRPNGKSRNNRAWSHGVVLRQAWEFLAIWRQAKWWLIFYSSIIPNIADILPLVYVRGKTKRRTRHLLVNRRGHTNTPLSSRSLISSAAMNAEMCLSYRDNIYHIRHIRFIFFFNIRSDRQELNISYCFKKSFIDK